MRSVFRKSRQGSVTILTVVLIGFMLLAFIYADNVVAIQEKIMTRNDSLTEQAFYAAQACIEEGYLQLRTNEHYVGTTLQVNGAICTVSVTPDPTNSTSGTLKSVGTYHGIIRTIISRYIDAGGTTSSQPIVAFHVIDRSGSMNDLPEGCTVAGATNKNKCAQLGGVWGPQPITSAKEAAKGFIDTMHPEKDSIGVISYSDSATLDHYISNDFNSVKHANPGITPGWPTNPRGIDYIPSPSGQTYIGKALRVATDKLQNISADNVRVELLLTDGWPDDEVVARAEAERAKSKGITVVTIGLGNINEEFLKDMASIGNNGEPLYFYASNGQALADIYSEIASTLISYNITQKTWGEQ